jgi:hypothetical protein
VPLRDLIEKAFWARSGNENMAVQLSST